jgi:hypothetical protein
MCATATSSVPDFLANAEDAGAGAQSAPRRRQRRTDAVRRRARSQCDNILVLQSVGYDTNAATAGADAQYEESELVRLRQPIVDKQGDGRVHLMKQRRGRRAAGRLRRCAPITAACAAKTGVINSCRCSWKARSRCA